MHLRFKNLDFPHGDSEFKATTKAAARTVFDANWAVKEVEKEDEAPTGKRAPAKPPTNLMKAKTSVGAFLNFQGLGDAAPPIPVHDELDRYMALPEVMDKDIDVLEWWRRHEEEYPQLSRMARQFLAVPATSAGAERVFSRAGRLHDDFKKSTGEETLEDSLMVSVNHGK